MEIDTLIAPYHLNIDQDGNIHEENGKNFDVKAYSRMKYGVHSELMKFAKELAAELLLRAPQLFSGKEPPAILTSYKAAAPPATTLARYCLDQINLARFRANLMPGEMVQVYRPKDYIQEYAVLSVEERRKLMGDQTTNTLRGRKIDGYIPVVIDDIYVTGTYTAMMRQVLKSYKNICAAFLAICGSTIKDSPHVEALLNTSEISKARDMLPYIKSGNFVFTRRYLKMLLRTPPDELRAVVAQLPPAISEQVIRAIIDTDSELQRLFPEAVKIIVPES